MIILRKRFLTIASIISVALTVSPSAWSWGPVGHRVASRMAEDRLTPAALAAVHNLLGPGVSLAQISNWADEQPNPSGSASWHYVNVPISESRYDVRYCPSSGCVVSKIEDFKRVLKSPKASKTEKQQALKFLVHMIEDLCQPLHVGDTGNKGGNLIQVEFYSTGSNLHRVWDSKIIERHTMDERVWLWDLNGVTNPKLAAEWAKGTPEDWATDSLQIAKRAYCLPETNRVMKSGTRIGNDYCSMALPIIQKQLAKAGVRLASALNEIFGDTQLHKVATPN